MVDKNILEIEWYFDDLHETLTIEEYFKKLLLALWIDGECFDGKRPFGNSGWDRQIYSALISNEIIEGSFDEYGYIKDFDQVKADNLIIKSIKSLGI